MRWLMFALLGLVACGEADGGAIDVSVEAESSGALWEKAIDGLPGALLSVWGNGQDVWAVGADARDGTGPMIVLGTVSGGWRRVDARAVDLDGGNLWWVYGAPGAEAVTIVGERGRVLRVDGDGDVAAIASGTDATLYGVWGASEDVMWAVGGYVLPRTGAPTIVKLTKAGGEVVALPADLPANGTFFKVWGAATDDVWVVGEKGMVVHWDGATWTNQSLAGEPRLVTVHGRSGADLVAVGGAGEGLIFEGRAFGARDVAGISPLNGVFVTPEGPAWAVGMLGQVLRREAIGGAWNKVVTGIARSDWHAVWVDARGDVWVVGGDLLSRLDRGVLARFGPARSDVPSGSVKGLEPSEVEPERVEVREVVDEEVVEPAEIVEAAEIAEVIDAAEIDEVFETSEDSAIEIAEIEADLGPDLDASEDAEAVADSDPMDVEVIAPGELEVGFIRYPEDVFEVFPADVRFGIVHGPQGGIHVEVSTRFACDASESELLSAVDLHLEIDSVDVARFVAEAYPMRVVGDGTCLSYVMPIQFDSPDPTPFVGKTARVIVRVMPPGRTLEKILEGPLYDTF